MIRRLSVYAHKQNIKQVLSMHTHVHDLYTMVLSEGISVYELLVSKTNGLIFHNKVITPNMMRNFVTVPVYLKMLQTQEVFPRRKRI